MSCWQLNRTFTTTVCAAVALFIVLIIRGDVDLVQYTCPNGPGYENYTTSLRIHSPGIKKIKILCWIPTCKEKRAGAFAVKRTWGGRCDKTLYISDVTDNTEENNDTLPATPLDVPTGEYQRRLNRG